MATIYLYIPKKHEDILDEIQAHVGKMIELNPYDFLNQEFIIKTHEHALDIIYMQNVLTNIMESFITTIKDIRGSHAFKSGFQDYITPKEHS